MSGADAYFDSKILSAEPSELVEMLYQAGLDAVVEARQHLAAGRVAARSAAITKAFSIIAELNSSLNHALGGELSANLARLYSYMQGRLLDANFRQAEPPLSEVASLLKTLLEAWSAVRHSPATPAEDQTPADESGTVSPPSAHRAALDAFLPPDLSESSRRVWAL